MAPQIPPPTVFVTTSVVQELASRTAYRTSPGGQASTWGRPPASSSISGAALPPWRTTGSTRQPDATVEIEPTDFAWMGNEGTACRGDNKNMTAKSGTTIMEDLTVACTQSRSGKPTSTTIAAVPTAVATVFGTRNIQRRIGLLGYCSGQADLQAAQLGR